MWAHMELTTSDLDWMGLAEALAKVLRSIHGSGGMDRDMACEHLRAVLSEGNCEALEEVVFLIAFFTPVYFNPAAED